MSFICPYAYYGPAALFMAPDKIGLICTLCPTAPLELYPPLTLTPDYLLCIS